MTPVQLTEEALRLPLFIDPSLEQQLQTEPLGIDEAMLSRRRHIHIDVLKLFVDDRTRLRTKEWNARASIRERSWTRGWNEQWRADLAVHAQKTAHRHPLALRKIARRLMTVNHLERFTEYGDPLSRTIAAETPMVTLEEMTESRDADPRALAIYLQKAGFFSGHYASQVKPSNLLRREYPRYANMYLDAYPIPAQLQPEEKSHSDISTMLDTSEHMLQIVLEEGGICPVIRVVSKYTGQEAEMYTPREIAAIEAALKDMTTLRPGEMGNEEIMALTGLQLSIVSARATPEEKGRVRMIYPHRGGTPRRAFPAPVARGILNKLVGPAQAETLLSGAETRSEDQTGRTEAGEQIESFSLENMRALFRSGEVTVYGSTKNFMSLVEGRLNQLRPEIEAQAALLPESIREQTIQTICKAIIRYEQHHNCISPEAGDIANQYMKDIIASDLPLGTRASAFLCHNPQSIASFFKFAAEHYPYMQPSNVAACMKFNIRDPLQAVRLVGGRFEQLRGAYTPQQITDRNLLRACQTSPKVSIPELTERINQLVAAHPATPVGERSYGPYGPARAQSMSLPAKTPSQQREVLEQLPIPEPLLPATIRIDSPPAERKPVVAATPQEVKMSHPAFPAGERPYGTRGPARARIPPEYDPPWHLLKAPTKQPATQVGLTVEDILDRTTASRAAVQNVIHTLEGRFNAPEKIMTAGRRVLTPYSGNYLDAILTTLVGLPAAAMAKRTQTPEHLVIKFLNNSGYRANEQDRYSADVWTRVQREFRKPPATHVLATQFATQGKSVTDIISLVEKLGSEVEYFYASEERQPFLGAIARQLVEVQTDLPDGSFDVAEPGWFNRFELAERANCSLREIDEWMKHARPDADQVRWFTPRQDIKDVRFLPHYRIDLARAFLASRAQRKT